ncbi:TCB3, partial [Symbiodinium sp. KB8]
PKTEMHLNQLRAAGRSRRRPRGKLCTAPHISAWRSSAASYACRRSRSSSEL